MSEDAKQEVPAIEGEATEERAGEKPVKPRVLSKALSSAYGAVKKHPLGALAAVGAAAALIEVELAVGVLAGLGATALLSTKSGPEARQEMLERGKWAYQRARGVLSRGSGAAEPEAKQAPEGAAPAES